VVVDDTPPALTLDVGTPRYEGADTFVTSATPFTVTASDGGAMPVGVASLEYATDGGSWTPYATPFTLTGPDGAKLVEYRAADFLGHTATGQLAVVLDDTPPAIVVEVGQPKHAGTELFVTSTTPFTLSASDGGVDPVGLATIEYRAGTGPWIPYGTPFALSGPDGPKAVAYRATDLLGNTCAGQIDVVLDDTPPVTTPSHGDGAYPSGTALGFTAADAGSGVARTEVRVDGGAWATYAAPLELADGPHEIRFRSVDQVNNTEAERLLSVATSGEPPPPIPPEPNRKLLVAVVFASLLVLVGAWSARRVPWPSGPRRTVRAFALIALPFVLAEAGTGVVSLLTGLLSIPPILGLGTAVDLGILVAGVAVLVYRVRKWTPPE
jgi:hypothetical protein